MLVPERGKVLLAGLGGPHQAIDDLALGGLGPCHRAIHPVQVHARDLARRRRLVAVAGPGGVQRLEVPADARAHVLGELLQGPATVLHERARAPVHGDGARHDRRAVLLDGGVGARGVTVGLVLHRGQGRLVRGERVRSRLTGAVHRLHVLRHRRAVRLHLLEAVVAEAVHGGQLVRRKLGDEGRQGTHELLLSGINGRLVPGLEPRDVRLVRGQRPLERRRHARHLAGDIRHGRLKLADEARDRQTHRVAVLFLF